MLVPLAQISWTNSARLLTSALANTRLRCCLTVFSLINARRAISLVVNPSLTRLAISCSLFVNTPHSGKLREILSILVDG